MNLLIDTHVFIWWDSLADQMSEWSRKLVSDASNTIYLNMASLWEIQIKHHLGKLEIRKLIDEIVREQQQNGVLLLPIRLEHIIALDSIGEYHKDPFDRLLIAQAKHEQLTVVTRDKAFHHYGVPVLWK